MPLGTSLVSNIEGVEINGVIAEDTSAQIQSLYSGNTLTPLSNFSFPWNGTIISFLQGVSVEVPADLLAALTAASAPFSQP